MLRNETCRVVQGRHIVPDQSREIRVSFLNTTELREMEIAVHDVGLVIGEIAPDDCLDSVRFQPVVSVDNTDKFAASACDTLVEGVGDSIVRLTNPLRYRIPALF